LAGYRQFVNAVDGFIESFSGSPGYSSGIQEASRTNYMREVNLDDSEKDKERQSAIIDRSEVSLFVKLFRPSIMANDGVQILSSNGTLTPFSAVRTYREKKRNIADDFNTVIEDDNLRLIVSKLDEGKSARVAKVTKDGKSTLFPVTVYYNGETYTDKMFTDNAINAKTALQGIGATNIDTSIAILSAAIQQRRESSKESKGSSLPVISSGPDEDEDEDEDDGPIIQYGESDLDLASMRTTASGMGTKSAGDEGLYTLY
jgi:hypothetical protein